MKPGPQRKCHAGCTYRYLPLGHNLVDMDLELRHMELVCRIHEAGSISHAARRLGMSQPSLTAALNRIEKAVGGRLFLRGQQGITPTDLGMFLLERAKPLVEEVKALTVAVRRRAESGEREVLRIALAPTPYLGDFLAAVEARVRLSATVEFGFADLLGRLNSGTLDAAVLGYAPALRLDLGPGLRLRHLVEAEPCWVAMSRRHPLAGSSQLSLDDLAEQDWVAPPGGDFDGTTAAFESACRDAGFVPRVRYRMADSAAITQLLVRTKAVIVAQPTCRCPEGVAAIPLKDDPITFRSTFVWRPEALSNGDSIFELLVRAYDAVIDNNDGYRSWWDANPWAHLDPAWKIGDKGHV